MRIYRGRGLRHLLKPKAEADNTNRGFIILTYPTRTEFNNCFIYLYSYRTQGKRLLCKQDLFLKNAICRKEAIYAFDISRINNGDVIRLYKFFQYSIVS